MESNKKPNIIIIGASGHSKIVIDIIERENKYTIYGLLDSYVPKGTKVFDYEVLGTEALIPELLENNQIVSGIIAIGANYNRIKMVSKIARISPGFSYITAIHPQAVIGKDVIIGAGTVIVAGVIINTCSIIKKHTIINTKVSVGHDCLLGDFVSLAPGTTIGGGVTINEGAIIGIGATIIGRRNIGAHALIGAGALVNKDVPEYTVAYGVPAKAIRKRLQSDSYL